MSTGTMDDKGFFAADKAASGLDLVLDDQLRKTVQELASHSLVDFSQPWLPGAC